MIQAKKSLGQHFLRDANVSRKIVAFLDPKPGETIVEIGPGTGALTSLLAESGASIIAVEIDGRACEHLSSLKQERRWQAVQIHQADFLEFDFSSIPGFGEGKIRIVGNLPYNITSPILFRLFEHSASIRDAVLMMQYEVAERVCSKPGGKEYGILSVMTRYFAEARIAFPVSREVFVPKPAVKSCVVHLRFFEKPKEEAVDFECFRRVVRGTFGVRRKTVANGLRNIGIPTEKLGSSFADLLLKRPEQLSIHDFIMLSNAVAHV